jgi:hypothetical protein
VVDGLEAEGHAAIGHATQVRQPAVGPQPLDDRPLGAINADHQDRRRVGASAAAGRGKSGEDRTDAAPRERRSRHGSWTFTG